MTFKVGPRPEGIHSNGLADRINENTVTNLLGRIPIELAEDEIRGAIEGRVVLVTGAAGSIGSELCRQIARFGPAAIIGLDCAESPLFELDEEMRATYQHLRFHAEIGNIQSQRRLNAVFLRYRPRTVFHAAAYKHVPLMERHVFEAVENNILGTYYVALACSRYGVRDFVLISSDKAVAPASIMGATKRITELLILELQKGGTKYVAVRFGNVLWSNGSVIPTFLRQIARGGPVTVTHPEMQRFFMTVQEACQLVLQASVIAETGQICVLDMGEPVKIVDLARRLILLAGLKPEEDIRIEFTGIRPGEKLVEALISPHEQVVSSSHPRIRLIVSHRATTKNVTAAMARFQEACETEDAACLSSLVKQLLPEYSPSSELLGWADLPAPAIEVQSETADVATPLQATSGLIVAGRSITGCA